FDGKADEGFLVRKSLSSKAFRVYNLVTKKVEENLTDNQANHTTSLQEVSNSHAGTQPDDDADQDNMDELAKL
ncbi:hypothetical protein Tco_1128960, partial [Tanacetum coccineum]